MSWNCKYCGGAGVLRREDYNTGEIIEESCFHPSMDSLFNKGPKIDPSIWIDKAIEAMRLKASELEKANKRANKYRVGGDNNGPIKSMHEVSGDGD